MFEINNFNLNGNQLPVVYCSERIYDDESFPERQLAALVASKVSFFYKLTATDVEFKKKT